jgi:hypothetical protein
MGIFDNEGGADNPSSIPYATDEDLNNNNQYWNTESGGTPNPRNYDYATPAELAREREYGYEGTHGATPTFLDNLGTALSSAGNTLLKNFLTSASTPSGIAGLITALSGARGLFDKGFITPAKGGFQGTLNANLKATRAQPTQQTYTPYSGKPVIGTDYGISHVTYAAKGGIMGQHPKPPRYLSGNTDGMADEIDTSIDDTQRAKLSHGEFVIPADVVSHLGNGNSSAGADVLYKMMERVRKARTGNPKQGKQIKPEKFTPGGIAGYAGGGAVAFEEGGNVVQEQTISNWATPGITDVVNRGMALSREATPVYQGPLTAGQSPLQGQAFGNLGKLTGSLNDFGTVQSYMNPYINSVMNQQSDEARRQAAITQTGINSQATQQNAFGGSRSAIMGAENNRNLGTTLANIQASGLNRAYDNAMNQQVQAGRYGLDALGRQIEAGGIQRGIEQQGIDARKAQFEQQAADPYKRIQFAKDIFTGLPIQTNNTNVNYSSQDNWLNQVNQILPFLGGNTSTTNK